MRKVSGWALVAAVCISGIAFGQSAREGGQPAATRNRAEAQDRAGQAQPDRNEGRARRQAVPPRGTQEQARGGGGRMGATADQQIAAKIYGGNRNEVELAKFAMDRLQSDQAKEFAAMMVKDHSPVAEKMAERAGPLVSTAAGEARGENAVPREGANPASRDGVRGTATAPAGDANRTGGDATARRGQGFVRWVSIHKEIADQCLKSTKEELGRYQGHDFDKAYLGHQLAAHMKMLDELKVLRNHASSELQQDIEKGIAMTQEHIEHARKIMEQEKDKGSTGSDGRSERPAKATDKSR